MIYRFHYFIDSRSMDTNVYEVRGCSTKREAIAKMDSELGETVLISHTEELTADDADVEGFGGF